MFYLINFDSTHFRSEREFLRDELDKFRLVEEDSFVQGSSSVLVPGERQSLRGHQLLHHRDDPCRRGVVEDTDRVL